ncbi:MAG: DEAD/DEAH box helicase [Acidimicrobiales bacterium]
MARSVILRRWQKTALERLAASPHADFLAVATPGAGKTTFALTAARQAIAAGQAKRLVVVAPTQHLKLQWAKAAATFDLHLDPSWAAADGALPRDMHGIVTTYQQVATSAAVLRALCPNAFVVFDEIHHAADDRAWGDAVREAFEPATQRLSLSGTPFRSDTSPIPFVHYDDTEQAVADFEYGYGDALHDGGVVRPVYFPRLDGHMEWTAPDGSHHSHSFDDALDHVRANQRLRTALSVEGDWLPTVLAQAHQRLVEIRRSQPDAGGLIIATDQEHAKGIAGLLRGRLGVQAVVATSDDPDASSLITSFATGTQPWIVAVRMVSEGVDIPRLRVGVFATTTTTELFFRQAVGRLVRWVRGVPGQRSYLFIPDDPRLRARAFALAEQRRHSLSRERVMERAQVERELMPGDEEQMSLFAVISATPLGETDGPDWITDEAPWDGIDVDDDALVLDLPPLPWGVLVHDADGGGDGRTRREQKEMLRLANADRARDIARATKQTHAQVNAELNRMSGITRITEATVEQLKRRLRYADGWRRRTF